MNLTASNSFSRKLAEHDLPLRHTRTEILQINVGKLCNLTCIHCHVNAGPKRKEIMTRETIDRVGNHFGLYPNRSSPIRSAASRCMLPRTCEYRSNVIETEL